MRKSLAGDSGGAYQADPQPTDDYGCYSSNEYGQKAGPHILEPRGFEAYFRSFRPKRQTRSKELVDCCRLSQGKVRAANWRKLGNPTLLSRFSDTKHPPAP